MSDNKFLITIGIIAYVSWPLYFFLIDQGHEYKAEEITQAMIFATAALAVYAISLVAYLKKS